MYKFRIFSLIFCSLLLFSMFGCAKKRPFIEPADGWYAAWLAAPEKAEPENIPQNPTLRGSTCRQQIKPSIGGDKLRIVLSNELSESSLTIESVHIAKLLASGDPTIDPATDVAVTFNSKESVTVAAGKTVTSDEISLGLSAQDYLAVSMEFSDKVPAYPTCHRKADCTAWIVEGSHVSDETFDKMSLMPSTYFLSQVDVWAQAGTETIVACGDFISDASEYNSFGGWVGQLSALLQKNDETKQLSAVNYAFDDNSVQRAAKYVEDEILAISGVHGAILQLGDNDISVAQSDTSEKIIGGFKEIIKACHEKGVSVYACTIPPFEGSTVYYSELHEKIRTAVNTFITSPTSGFDGIADFEQVLCYAEKPSKMQSQYDSGDGITPNAEGQKVMGMAANEMLREAYEKQAVEE